MVTSPAGGSFDVQFANNRAFSKMGLHGGRVSTFPDGEVSSISPMQRFDLNRGKPHPEYDVPGYYDAACVPNPLRKSKIHFIT